MNNCGGFHHVPDQVMLDILGWERICCRVITTEESLTRETGLEGKSSVFRASIRRRTSLVSEFVGKIL